MEVRLI